MSVELIDAVVRAGATETEYVRAGRGSPVLLLTRRTPAALLEDPLFASLAAEFSVIVPALPGAGVPAGKWVRDLMDGLGFADRGRVLLDVPDLSDEVINALLRALGSAEGD
jgi:hypothetical protein